METTTMPIDRLIADLRDDFSRPDVFWQIAVIALAAVAAVALRLEHPARTRVG